jgi:hypothetical protein
MVRPPFGNLKILVARQLPFLASHVRTYLPHRLLAYQPPAPKAIMAVTAAMVMWL